MQVWVGFNVIYSLLILILNIGFIHFQTAQLDLNLESSEAMESCLYAVLEDWSLCLEIDKLVYYLARKYSLDAVQDSPQLSLKHVCDKYLY